MRRRDILLIILAAVFAAGWLLFRSPDGGGEMKGILKERLRAAESATQTLDAERAAGREKLRLARKKTDENRARFARAAAALPFYEQRRKEASAPPPSRGQARADVHNKLCTHPEKESFENISGSRIKSGMTRNRIESGMTGKRRADGEEQTAADNAALLRRLNALLQ